MWIRIGPRFEEIASRICATRHVSNGKLVVEVNRRHGRNETGNDIPSNNGAGVVDDDVSLTVLEVPLTRVRNGVQARYLAEGASDQRQLVKTPRHLLGARLRQKRKNLSGRWCNVVSPGTLLAFTAWAIEIEDMPHDTGDTGYVSSD